MNVVVDNFEIIKSLLPDKPEPDVFWVVRIIGRKKDIPTLHKNSVFYKAYTVQCKNELDELKEKIVEYAVKNKARAYFNPNARSWRRVALSTLKKIATYIDCENYSAVVNAADSSLDEGAATGHTKIWVIDIDESLQEIETKRTLEHIGVGIVAEIPTVSGKHFLVHPFNPEDFWKHWNSNSDVEHPEIKKNNPTLLYFNMVDNDDM